MPPDPETEPKTDPKVDPKTGPQAYAVAAIERAMDVVAALMRTGPATLSVIAAEAGCTVSVTFRILQTLRRHNLVAQDAPRGPWRMGPPWLAVGRAAEGQDALSHAAAGPLQALAASCGETTQFAVRDGEQSRVVAEHRIAFMPPPPLRLGARAPLHAGPGRLLLAYAPADVQSHVLASVLPRLAAATRIDAPWISADLPRIRQRGWLIAVGDVQDGVTTISHGVRDLTGTVFAAITILAPAHRMRVPRPQQLLTPLMAATTVLEAALGLGR